MPSKKLENVSHPDIKWGGFTLKQWYSTVRTAALRGGNPRDNEPDITVTARYVKGAPSQYDAAIRMDNVHCEVFNFGDPHAALNEMHERIHRLADVLDKANG